MKHDEKKYRLINVREFSSYTSCTNRKIADYIAGRDFFLNNNLSQIRFDVEEDYVSADSVVPGIGMIFTPSEVEKHLVVLEEPNNDPKDFIVIYRGDDGFTHSAPMTESDAIALCRGLFNPEQINPPFITKIYKRPVVKTVTTVEFE